MIRAEGWELRLVAEIAAAQRRAWAWGRHDCVSFAMACVTAMAGAPPAPVRRYAGRWSTRAGAARVLRNEALADVAAGLDRHFPRSDWRRARRGDLATLRCADGRPALGVIEGGWVWVAAETGLTRLPVDQALGCWEVG